MVTQDTNGGGVSGTARDAIGFTPRRSRVSAVRRRWWLVAVGLSVGLLVPSVASAADDVFAANGDGGTVSTLRVGAGGALTQQGTGVVSGSSSSSTPYALAVSANGQYLFSANQALGTVSTFTIGAGGALTQVGTGVISGTSASSKPEALAVSPNGQYLFATNSDQGTVSTFTIGAGGTLTQVGTGVISGTSSSSRPEGVAVSPNGSYLYDANYVGGTVSTFTIGTGGALTQQGTGVVSGANTNSLPYGLAIAPNGQVLYATNASGTVSTFTIGVSGALTQQGTGVMSGSSTTSYPYAVTVSPNGQYLFAANTGPGTVSTFAIGAAGALTQVGTGTVTGSSSSSNPQGLAVSPDGQYLYVANQQQGTVSTFTIGADGSLTQQGTGATTGTGIGSGPDAVVVAPDQGPVAEFTVSPASAGTASTFSATGSAAGTEPVETYAWEFGDGASATGAQVSHTYAAPGSYTVTLTLMDSDGCSVFGPFTGQSPYCALDPAATASQTIAVPTAPATTTTVATTVPTSTPPPARAQSVTVGDQRVTLTLPAGSLCEASTATLVASLSSTTLEHGTKVRFKLAGFSLDKGIRHTHKHTVSHHGKTVTVTLSSYSPNATATQLPTSRQLSLAGLKPGTHTLMVKLSYEETRRVTVKRGRTRVTRDRESTVIRTISAKFTVC